MIVRIDPDGRVFELPVPDARMPHGTEHPGLTAALRAGALTALLAPAPRTIAPPAAPPRPPKPPRPPAPPARDEEDDDLDDGTEEPEPFRPSSALPPGTPEFDFSDEELDVTEEPVRSPVRTSPEAMFGRQRAAATPKVAPKNRAGSAGRRTRADIPKGGPPSPHRPITGGVEIGA